MKILQLIPATGWYAVYAEHIETSELKLWREPLIAWALVEWVLEEREGRNGVTLDQSIEGIVNFGDHGPTIATETAGFVLKYVQVDEDLERHRHWAETLITMWERRDLDDLDTELPKN